MAGLTTANKQLIQERVAAQIAAGGMGKEQTCCIIGTACGLIKTSDLSGNKHHQAFSLNFGVSIEFAKLLEAIFECLPDNEVDNFASGVAERIPVGADLNDVSVSVLRTCGVAVNPDRNRFGNDFWFAVWDNDERESTAQAMRNALFAEFDRLSAAA